MSDEDPTKPDSFPDHGYTVFAKWEYRVSGSEVNREHAQVPFFSRPFRLGRRQSAKAFGLEEYHLGIKATRGCSSGKVT